MKRSSSMRQTLHLDRPSDRPDTYNLGIVRDRTTSSCCERDRRDDAVEPVVENVMVDKTAHFQPRYADSSMESPVPSICFTRPRSHDTHGPSFTDSTVSELTSEANDLQPLAFCSPRGSLDAALVSHALFPSLDANGQADF